MACWLSSCPLSSLAIWTRAIANKITQCGGSSVGDVCRWCPLCRTAKGLRAVTMRALALACSDHDWASVRYRMSSGGFVSSVTGWMLVVSRRLHSLRGFQPCTAHAATAQSRYGSTSTVTRLTDCRLLYPAAVEAQGPDRTISNRRDCPLPPCISTVGMIGSGRGPVWPANTLWRTASRPTVADRLARWRVGGERCPFSGRPDPCGEAQGARTTGHRTPAVSRRRSGAGRGCGRAGAGCLPRGCWRSAWSG